MSKNRQWMLAALVGALAAGAQAEIVLSEKVKVDGFLDMSAVHIEGEDDSTDTLSFDQWEVDIHLAPMDGVAARIDIDDQPAAQEGAEIEQAFITLDLGKGFSAKAGKFLSVLGYEGAEPTLLYQYSVSATIIGYPGYSSGVGLKYDFSGGSLYVAGVDGSYSGDGDAGSVSPEIQLVLKPIEGLTLQAGYATEEFEATTTDEDEDGVLEPVPGFDKGIANVWAEYKTGGLTVAAEYNSLFDMQGAGSDGDGYLVMLNYDWGKPALTLRHSAVELDNGYEDTEFTISPSYQLAEPLLVLVEYRHDDYGDAGEADTIAAEAIFMF